MALLTICASMTIVSCDFVGGTANDAQNDSVKISIMQKDSLMRTRNLFNELSHDMREELLNILWEIDDIAGETFELERKRESEGAVEEKTADLIKKRIAFVKEKIDNAEKKAGDNAQLHTTLLQLKKSMIDKEKEIERLRVKLDRKKSQLEEEYDNLMQKKDELEFKQIVLEKQNRELELSIQELQNSQNTAWSKVGDKLMESTDIITVTKKKNLGRKVMESKQKVVEQAISCYKKSKAMGDPMADSKISRAESKLQQLREQAN